MINKESKTFNKNNFNDAVSALKNVEPNLIQRRGAITKQSFVEEGNRLLLVELNSDDQAIKSTVLEANGEAIVKEKIDDYFDYFEMYHSNNNIKRKVISSDLGFAIGKEYIFNDEGELVQEIDLDNGYDFTFENLLKFLNDKNIDILLREGVSNTIRKVNNNNRKTWVIEYFNSEINKIEIYVLDGKTGEVIISETKDKPEFRRLN